MGLYISFEDLKVRVEGKVRFTEDPEADPDLMPVKLAKRLINEAEGQVELSLMQRYQIPFQTSLGEPFQSLPTRPTKELLRTLCELKAVSRVLETDFGQGTTVDAEKYKEKIDNRYKAIVKDLLERHKDDVTSYVNWVRPPLPGIMLAAHNEQDDGFDGYLVNTTGSRENFAAGQINDPSVTIWNVHDEDCI